jgi:DNA-binding transcriptional LysR family regulator
VQIHLNEGRLVEVLPELATDGLPMNLVWLKTRESLPKVSILLKYLSEHLAPYGSVDADVGPD